MWRRMNFPHIFGTEVCIPLELVPRVMERELRDLVDLIPALEKATGSLMPQVMKSEIYDSKDMAGSCECSADALRLVREYVLAVRVWLPLNDSPCFRRVFEATVVSLLRGRVLCVSDQTSAEFGIVISSLEAAYFRFALRRMDCELQDIVHRDLCSVVPTRKKLAEPRELIWCWTSVPLP
jgi:hypothetical protein